jgi:uncharacterized protein YndB with AHSA1/START domain
MSTEIRIVRDYPHPRARVWRALVDPELVSRWMMRPEGFAPVVGNTFKLFAKPQPGWRGFVECEVLEVVDGRKLRYSWKGDENAAPQEVCWELEDAPGGARLHFAHTGFVGIGGWLLANVMMGPGWRKMLSRTIAAVLADQLPDGGLRPDSALQPRF